MDSQRCGQNKTETHLHEVVGLPFLRLEANIIPGYEIRVFGPILTHISGSADFTAKDSPVRQQTIIRVCLLFVNETIVNRRNKLQEGYR